MAGLDNALGEALHLGIPRIRQRIAHLAAVAREQLAQIDGLTLHDLGEPGQQSGLIALNLQGWDANALKEHLAGHGINIGANGVAYTPLDMQARGLASIARVSMSYLNTEEEIAELVRVLRG
jgi:selenocysteine lyase/cysteine desulfurase